MTLNLHLLVKLKISKEKHLHYYEVLQDWWNHFQDRSTFRYHLMTMYGIFDKYFILVLNEKSPLKFHFQFWFWTVTHFFRGYFHIQPATAADALMEIPEFSNDPNHLEIPMVRNGMPKKVIIRGLTRFLQINKRLRKITEESRTSSTGMSRKSSWLQTLRNSVLVPNESHLSLISVARNIQHTGKEFIILDEF